MLAGFSFFSRISKYLCEKYELGNISTENYDNFLDEGDISINNNKKEEKKDPVNQENLSNV